MTVNGIAIINNNGISGGPSELNPEFIPPMAYTPNAHYEKMIEGFGGKGYFATTPDELRTSLREAIAQKFPTIVNVAIDPKATRKPQKFEWLTR